MSRQMRARSHLRALATTRMIGTLLTLSNGVATASKPMIAKTINKTIKSVNQSALPLHLSAERASMLTLVEKILFIVAVGASLYFAGVGFYKVYKVVMRGAGEKPERQGHAVAALVRGVKLDHDAPDLEDAPVEQPLPHHDLGRLCLLFPGQLWRHHRGALPRHLPRSQPHRRLLPLPGRPGDDERADRRDLLHPAPLRLQRQGAELPGKCQAGRARQARRHPPRLADRGLLHPLSRRLPLDRQQFQALARRRRCVAALQHGAEPALAGLAGVVAHGGRAPRLLAGGRSDPGLPALLPLHQALPPDHVGRQLPHQAEAHLAGRAGADRLRG